MISRSVEARSVEARSCRPEACYQDLQDLTATGLSSSTQSHFPLLSASHWESSRGSRRTSADAGNASFADLGRERDQVARWYLMNCRMPCLTPGFGSGRRCEVLDRWTRQLVCCGLVSNNLPELGTVGPGWQNGIDSVSGIWRACWHGDHAAFVTSRAVKT